MASSKQELVVYNSGGMSMPLPSVVGTGARQKAIIGLIADGKFEKALEIVDPKFRHNGDLNHLLGQVAIQKQDYPLALSYLRKADFATPGNTHVRADIALAFYFMGKKTAAKMLLNQLLVDTHPPAQGCYVMGLIACEEGEWEEAEKHYKKCIELNFDHAEANFELGVLLLEDDRFEEAYRYCMRSIELLPEDAPSHTNAGQAALRLGRYALAEQHLRRSLSLHPKGRRARFSLGLCLIERGQENEAMLIFRDLIDLEPSLYADVVRAITRAGRGIITVNPFLLRQKLFQNL